MSRNNSNRNNTNNKNNDTSVVVDENMPLLMNPSNASGDYPVGNGVGGGNQYYFVHSSNNSTTSNAGGGGEGQLNNSLVRDGDGIQVVEEIPDGSHCDEFAPKILPPPTEQSAPVVAVPSFNHPTHRNTITAPTTLAPSSSSTKGGFWSHLFSMGQQRNKSRQQNHHNHPNHQSHPPIGEINTMVKLRKAPIKIEPKVFFANERTFLAWMHLSVTLAGASIAILAFAEDQNPYSQLYGVLLLPVAIAFIVYSMYQYARRSTMIRRRHPGPYDDRVGPTFLGVMLMLSIVAQFALKLYSMARV